MPQAGRPYTPGPLPPTLRHSAIATSFAQRQSYAAARDACPIEQDESVMNAICGRLAALDQEILAFAPTSPAEIAAQAAVVLDSDSEFITDNARLVLGRVLDLAHADRAPTTVA